MRSRFWRGRRIAALGGLEETSWPGVGSVLRMRELQWLTGQDGRGQAETIILHVTPTLFFWLLRDTRGFPGGSDS